MIEANNSNNINKSNMGSNPKGHTVALNPGLNIYPSCSASSNPQSQSHTTSSNQKNNQKKRTKNYFTSFNTNTTKNIDKRCFFPCRPSSSFIFCWRKTFTILLAITTAFCLVKIMSMVSLYSSQPQQQTYRRLLFKGVDSPVKVPVNVDVSVVVNPDTPPPRFKVHSNNNNNNNNNVSSLDHGHLNYTSPPPRFKEKVNNTTTNKVESEHGHTQSKTNNTSNTEKTFEVKHPESINNTSTTSKQPVPSRPRYFKATGFKFCTILENALFDSTATIIASSSSSSSSNKKDADNIVGKELGSIPIDDFVKFIDREADFTYQLLIKQRPATIESVSDFLQLTLFQLI
jgi:hypothetical protein